MSLALLAGFAVTHFLSFPHRVGDDVIDLGWLLAWASPAFLIAGLNGLAPRAALGWGMLAGWLAHTAILHWIYVVTVTYGHAPPVVGVVAPAGLAIYIAIFTAGFACSWRFAASRGFDSPWIAAALWTVFDHARAFVFTGFPWGTIGYAQHENGALLGLASITGVYGLSFVTALGGASLVELIRAARQRRLPGLGTRLALAAVVLLQLIGLAVRPDASHPDAVSVRMAALQGNIDQGAKWSPEWRDRTVDIYDGLTRAAAADGARVIVWPETAVPGAIEMDEGLRLHLERLSRETQAALVVGGVGVEVDPSGQLARFFDSAFFFEPGLRLSSGLDPAEGEGPTRYDKSHLVPFGEYVPFRDWLGQWIGAVARGMASRDVTAGPGPEIRRLATPIGFNAGVPICYELLFPDLVRRFVSGGGQALLAITNDAWYGSTGAPYQFLAITALRSAETGAWTVRAANTGVSAFIDGRGRVREQTEIFERGWIAADVPLLPPEAKNTVYVRYGEVFTWGCWLVGLVVFAVGRRRGAPGNEE